MIMYTYTRTQCHTESVNQNQSGSVDSKGASLFSTALEVIPGHPIAFALQSLLLASRPPPPQVVSCLKDRTVT